MACPALPVSRAGKEPVAHAGVSFLRRAHGKRVQLFARRGQADQIERNAPQEHLGRRW